MKVRKTDIAQQSLVRQYLPAGYQEREPLLCGYVVKSGPGYPIPVIVDDGEPWKSKQEDVKYVPLQPHEGDLALFLKNNAWEIQFNGEKYLIVPHSAILMLVRNDDLFK